jgi:hypothetical protein
VRQLVEPALAEGWRTAWWALDETHPLVSDITVGEGPGLKLPLLNETLRSLGSADAWTILSDDDLRFRSGDVTKLLQWCERASLDLAQPARAAHTQHSHEITVAVPRSRVRMTTFIESGPLFVVGPRFRDRILPLPESRGMGWGLEIDWHDLIRDGCRLGIVDRTPVEHLGEWAGDYDRTELHEALVEELQTHGHPMWSGMRETVGTWRPWQKRPPWT